MKNKLQKEYADKILEILIRETYVKNGRIFTPLRYNEVGWHFITFQTHNQLFMRAFETMMSNNYGLNYYEQLYVWKKYKNYIDEITKLK